MGTTPTIKGSLLDKLTNTVYLDYVLKAVGIIIFVVAFISGWKHVTFFEKLGFIIGPIMWYVGQRFNKIYR